MKVTTAGGVKVATGDGIAWTATQVRALVERRYPAFVRRQDTSVELRRSPSGTWEAVTQAPTNDGLPVRWARELVAMLNEQEKENAAHDNNHDVP